MSYYREISCSDDQGSYKYNLHVWPWQITLHLVEICPMEYDTWTPEIFNSLATKDKGKQNEFDCGYLFDAILCRMGGHWL